MKKVILGCFLLANMINVFSQRNIKIEYDKYTDLVVYKEVKVQNGKRFEEIFRKVPKIAKGDIITLKINNLNTFLYRADIIQKGAYSEVKAASKLPGFLGTILGGLSPIGNVFSSFDDISSVFSSRGENSLSKEQNIVLTEVHKSLEKVQFVIDNFNSSISDINQALNVLYSENLPIGEEKLKLINSLEDVNLKINKPNNIEKHLKEIQELMLKSNFSIEEINQLLDDYYFTKNSMKEALNSSTGILLTKEGINSLINELKASSFSYEEKFQFDELLVMGSKSLSLDEGEIGLTGLNYEILFYDLKRKSETYKIVSDNPSDKGKLVRYFYSDKYTNADGKIVDSLCSECKPLIKAEGHLMNNASVPRYVEGLYMVHG
jgi:hypothetical protein